MRLSFIICFFLLISQLSIAQEIAEFEGAIKIKSLEGQQNQNVVADQNGVLQLDESTKILSIPASSFMPIDQKEISWRSSERSVFFNATNNTGMIAPIILPNGAAVDSIQVFFGDYSENTDNCEFRFSEFSNLTGVVTLIASELSFDTPDIGLVNFDKVTLIPNTTYIVENAIKTLSIVMGQAVGDLDFDFAIFQVVVFYR